MAIREILIHPAICLKQTAERVSDFGEEFQAICTDLEDTLLQAPGCVGIAAPQIGISQRVVIVDVKASEFGQLVLVNPEILDHEGLVRGREGCLSVPDFTGNVIRAEKIVVNAQSKEGEQVTFEFTGFEARVVQHEIDHLDGLLFLDRLISRRHDLFKRKIYKANNS